MGCMVGLVTFFFFKQKTAYEMRISDWSSDVCSSDLFRSPGTMTMHDALLPDIPRLRGLSVGRACGRPPCELGAPRRSRQDSSCFAYSGPFTHSLCQAA